MLVFFFSSRRRHTRCALVTGVQTCALPILSKVDPDGLSFAELSAAISDLKDAGRPVASLEANLWHKISGPLSAVLMPLLGALAAFGLARSGKLFEIGRASCRERVCQYV